MLNHELLSALRNLIQAKQAIQAHSHNVIKLGDKTKMAVIGILISLINDTIEYLDKLK